MKFRGDSSGFALPTIVISSLILMIVLVAGLSASFGTRTSLDAQYYDQLTREAAEAGTAFAQACLEANNYVPQWTNAQPLTPSTDCSGNIASGCAGGCYVYSDAKIRLSFSVPFPSVGSGSPIIASSGAVSLLRSSNGAVWQTYNQQALQSGVSPCSISDAGKVIMGWNGVSVVASGGVDPAASWIATAAGNVLPGYTYYRKDFSTTQPGTYTLSVAADDSAEASIDGQFLTTSSATTSLTSGCHSLVVKVRNWSAFPNPSNLSAALKLNGASSPLVVSDGSWRVAAGGAVAFSNVNYYADPTAWTSARYLSTAVASIGGTWTTATGDSSAQYISTTGNYDVNGAYPSNSYVNFRDSRTITVSVPTQVRLGYFCDDSCTVYLDGNAVATNGNMTAQTVGVTLTEGSHQVGIILGNGGGPSAMAFAVVRTSDGAVLSSSDTTWTALTTWYATPQNPMAYNIAYKPSPDSSNINVLVVGGGGSGGGSTGGGGGAGGVVSTTQGIAVGSYSVVVGNGGAAPGNQNPGINGANSSFNGLVAIGGGGGAASRAGTTAYSAGSGGSGGGGQNYAGGVSIAGLGTVLQGNTGGPIGVSSGSGGGGAGGAGSNTEAYSIGGAGGIGIASSISGTLKYYGGGGGGGNGGSGGLGGGGNGVDVGSAGTVNTGGGGGGGWSYAYGNGGAGGSGVVIISYPTGSVTATGGTITTSGGNTVHTFTSSATFTVTAVRPPAAQNF